MTAGVLLDTSVALKLVRRDEELSDLADALVRDCIRTSRRLLIPPLLLIEATNALHQRVRRRSLSFAEAVSAISELGQLPLQQVQPPAIYERALAFAEGHQIPSAYDALYVVTAQVLGVDLWTADQKLLNTLGTRTPWVRSLRDYTSLGEEGGG